MLPSLGMRCLLAAFEAVADSNGEWGSSGLSAAPQTQPETEQRASPPPIAGPLRFSACRCFLGARWPQTGPALCLRTRLLVHTFTQLAFPSPPLR